MGEKVASKKKTDQKERRNRRGEGTVYKVEGGYIAAIDLPPVSWKANGQPNRNRKTQRFRLKKDADAQRKEWAIQLHLNGEIPRTSITVGEWFQTWMTVHVTPNLRPRTAESYDSIARTYLLPALGPNTKLDKLTAANVRAVQNYIESKGLSSTTARNAFRTLAKALETAVREGHLTNNPARRVEPPRARVATLDVLSLPEAVTLLEAVLGMPDGARFATSVLTAARRGEVIGLERDRVGDHLDLSWQLQRLKKAHGCDGTCGMKRSSACPQAVLKVPADFEHRHLQGSLYLTRPKSRAGWRVIPLVDPLKSILERHLATAAENPHGLVFAREDGSPITPDQFTDEWISLMRSLYGEERFVRLHDLRHTAVDLLYLAGVDEATIQEIVGHSTRQMTRQYKSRSSQERLRAAMERMAGLPGISVRDIAPLGVPELR